MSATVWVPRDTSALSVGAQPVASALESEARRRGGTDCVMLNVDGHVTEASTSIEPSKTCRSSTGPPSCCATAR